MSNPSMNPLAMSDEDFLKMNGPSSSSSSDTTDPTPNPQEEEEEEQAGEAGDAAAEGEGDPGEDGSQGEEEEEAGSDDTNSDEGDEGNGEEEGSEDPKPDATSEGDTPGDGEAKPDKPKDADPKAGDEPNYKALYEQVMAPFKANGKTFTPQSIDEVIQLAQMGANYTKKLQDIQPHRKVLLMLQNNDLLDEGKLSYLIDLDKKNPEAIKKLIKDSGLDPLDIDTESEPDYTVGNHQVTDHEARFHEVLSEVSSSDEGKQTIAVINESWDEASKEVIWTQPEVMTVIHEQRANGIYDQIVAEMDRQKTLGQIPPSVPFLQAYKALGDVLFAQAAQPNGTPMNSEPRKLDERPAAPKPKVSHGDKAKSASTTRTSSSQSKQPIVNPLAMSDEEFMKMDNLKNRL